LIDGFTETSPVNGGWVAMGNESRAIIENLGSFYLIMLCIIGYMFIYLLVLTAELCFTRVKKLR